MATTDRITKIPEVAGLEFDDATHTYRLDGLVIPSVSSIMEPLSKAKYTGISGRTLERAANKGTAVHNSIENWIKFEILDIPPEHEGYFKAFRKWWDDFRPVVVGSEVRICHSLMRYGGTIDLIGYIGDELTLVDYKSTYAISDMTCGVQLEAYDQALGSMGVKVQRKKILHIKKDGSYELHDYPASDVTRWRVFGSLKTVYDYIESYK
jgi:hypothetical protein